MTRKVSGRIDAYRVIQKSTGKQYIGISVNARRRWKRHVYDATHGRATRRFLLQRSIGKYGEDDFVFEVIGCAQTWDDAMVFETELIRQHDCIHPNGFNMTVGGEGAYGRKMSEESIRKISEAARKRHQERPMSEESRRKISEGNKGKKMTPEQIQKLKDRIITEETRKKLSEAGKGKPPTKGMSGRTHSPETLEKMREATKNRKPMSEEGRQKIAESNRRRALQKEVDSV